jgi:dimethylamine/trimethylamine dehydrogenase
MLEGKPVPDGHALVVDYDGYFMGVSLAEKLALEGRRVTLVTQLAEPAPYMQFTLEAHSMRRRLRELDITTVTGQVVRRIESDSVTLGPPVGGADEETTLQVDAVVLVTQRLSTNGLYRALKAQVGSDGLADQGVRGLYQIGDCVVPRLIADAVFDGHRLGREIDSPDPSRPLPALRERVVQAT